MSAFHDVLTRPGETNLEVLARALYRRRPFASRKAGRKTWTLGEHVWQPGGVMVLGTAIGHEQFTSGISFTLLRRTSTSRHTASSPFRCIQIVVRLLPLVQGMLVRFISSMSTIVFMYHIRGASTVFAPSDSLVPAASTT